MTNPRSRKKYEQFAHTGDIGIRVFGDNLKELFINAAIALFDIIVDVRNVKTELVEKIEVEGNDREELLVNWLSELNYLFFTEQKIFNKFDIEKLSETQLQATASGEKLDLQRHEIYKEVKAVTYHQLKIEQKGKQWKAQIIFDI